MGIVGNPTFPSLHREYLEITLTVSLIRRSEAEFKEFEPWLKCGLFHLKLY